MVEVAAASLDIASERIARIRSDRWIAYPRAMQAIDRLHELFEYPKRLRMPNLLIVGPTNNGKSMIAEKFRRDLSAPGAGTPIASQPVLKYLLGDIVNGRIFHAPVDGLNPGAQATLQELRLVRGGSPVTLRTLVGGSNGRVDLRFGQDEAGEMYVLTKQDGKIRKIAAA